MTLIIRMEGDAQSVTDLRKKLRSYRREDIRFNEPHFTQQLLMREGNRNEVVNNLLSPDNLVSYYTEKGKYGDVKYSLYFKMSGTRTMKIPVIFDLKGRKCIYVLTYIMRYRPWQTMIKRNK